MAILISSTPDKTQPARCPFSGHLEALRWHLFRSVVVVMSLALILFFFKEFLFDGVLLAPKKPTLYYLSCTLSFVNKLNLGDDLCITTSPFILISTDISAGLQHICGWPLLQVWCAAFRMWSGNSGDSSSLHCMKKSRYATGIVFYTSFLFLLGVLFRILHYHTDDE